MMKASEKGVPRVHPTQKPIKLMNWCIKQVGDPALILDPFMGGGSTGIAAMQRGLKFIGIEIDSSYFDIACQRIEDVQAATGSIKKANPEGFLY
jgi:site-specific DNA-methyltransferase (adenine-specific)/modification methylase